MSLFTFHKNPERINFQNIKPITRPEYEFIRKFVYEHSRINLGENKKELVMARLSKRLRALNISTYKDYLDYIVSNDGKEEITNLIDSISTNHTFFFREIQHFDFLENHVLPEITKANTQRFGNQLSVWSAATSSGEEPYSIALMLEEYFAKNPGWQWKIQCTDISTKILAKAREGIFSLDRVDKIRRDWLLRYFTKLSNTTPESYQINSFLRSKLIFTPLNLLAPKYPFTDIFDIIFCRNVMIYFDKQTQEELIQKLTQHLKPGGYLMIGHAESLTAIKHTLKMVRPAIYRRG
jgi:chemotaxis protein methyltransferase CheR